MLQPTEVLSAVPRRLLPNHTTLYLNRNVSGMPSTSTGSDVQMRTAAEPNLVANQAQSIPTPSLESRVAQLESDVGEIKLEVGAIKVGMEVLKGQFSGLRARLDAGEATMASMAADLRTVIAILQQPRA